MADAWDPRHGLVFLLEALDKPELDAEPDLDIVELAALLAQISNSQIAA